MPEKIELEFFPEIKFEIPESPGGSCCLKPVIKQSKASQLMYILAQHLEWKFGKRLKLKIPSKTESKITPVKKYHQFKADRRKKKIGVHKLPALALGGKKLCEGTVPDEKEIEKQVRRLLKQIQN